MAKEEFKPRNEHGYKIMKSRKGGAHEDVVGQRHPKRARLKEAQDREMRQELREYGAA